VFKVMSTRAWDGDPDTPEMTSVSTDLNPKVLPPVQVVVAAVALETVIALHPVTPVPLISTSAVKDGVDVPLV
jgi:hypothetical protein